MASVKSRLCTIEPARNRLSQIIRDCFIPVQLLTCRQEIYHFLTDAHRQLFLLRRQLARMSATPSEIPIVPSPDLAGHRDLFLPPWVLRNGHIQTLVGTYVFG